MIRLAVKGHGFNPAAPNHQTCSFSRCDSAFPNSGPATDTLFRPRSVHVVKHLGRADSTSRLQQQTIAQLMLPPKFSR